MKKHTLQNIIKVCLVLFINCIIKILILFFYQIIIDPDLLAARLSAQEARTQQLQQKYNESLEEYKKKLEEVRFVIIMLWFNYVSVIIFTERGKEAWGNTTKNWCIIRWTYVGWKFEKIFKTW